MIAICPACRKNFDVLWPHLWRYKINRNYFCSWTCYRLKQKKRKKEEKVSEQAKKRPRMTRVEMATAMQIWRDDGDIDSYLKAHGIGNIQKWKANQRTRKPAEAPKPKTAGDVMVSKKIETPESNWTPGINVYGPLTVTTPEPEKVKVVPAQATMEYKTTGISTPIGDWQYYKKNGYLDWTPLDGSGPVSLNLTEWREFQKNFPEVLSVLGVEL